MIRKILFFGFIASLVGFAMPSTILVLLRNKASTEAAESTPAGPETKAVKYKSGISRESLVGKVYKTEYIEETKAAITREIKAKGKADNFEVSKIVFTSEKTKRIAGQKQVSLTFTYEVKYKGKSPVKQQGSIQLASDESGKMFDSTIEI